MPVLASVDTNRYSLNPLVKLHWRQFDDDWLVFEAVSGQTHQLTPFSAAVLVSFDSNQKFTLAGLVQELDHFFDAQSGGSQLGHTEDVLNQLLSLGLVVRVA